ncbi:putative disease resistance RPP13-like protein 1 [Oryza glaberrima]|nr:putative disease resistance RPP13-like protein 1 [Oryza glaberrima]
MAALFASLAVRKALDTLSSLLPASLAASSSSSAANRARQEQDLEDMRMLERTMRRIHATLHDAEQHWDIHEESTKLRLKELKELAYDAEDVVEEYEYEVNRCKVEALELSASTADHKRKRQQNLENEDLFNSGMVAVPDELAVKTRKLIERFHEIKYYSDNFTLSDNDGERRIIPHISMLRKTSSLVFAKSILGREGDKNTIMEKLLPRDGDSVANPISVLAIVGMGGVGKTALAQLVYNDSRMRGSFDKHAWVCVSEQFDVINITKGIIQSLKKEECGLPEHSLDILQQILVAEIKGKKVLLVLDDVWSERRDCWELLCLPMNTTEICNIVVTTRSERVARLVQTMPDFYNLNCLSPDDSWTLFKQEAYANQGSGIPSNLVEIGRRIAEKCKGLPLAIKTLGSILRFETNEKKWRDVLDSELWNLEQSHKEVLPALELSYKHMPIYLKHCFVSLSLYPKDSPFNVFMVSLLQNYMHGHTFVMHDLVHDLACFLAGDEFFRLEGDKSTEIPLGTRYMSIVPHTKSIKISNSSESLRAVVTLGNIDIENPEALFLNCKKFRVIQVTEDGFAKVLLDCIGEMKLLRHLEFLGHSNAVELVISNSVSKLFNLQTLDFIACSLHGIGRLVNLQALPVIHLCNCGCFFNIRELRNMNKIRKLRIDGLCNVSSIIDANEALLHCKKDLQELELNFTASINDAHTQNAGSNQAIIAVSVDLLLESLRPHHRSLRELTLQNFNCKIYPSWLGSTSFSKLIRLVLRLCQSKHLPTLGELPSLKYLDIRQMENVERIGREFCTLDPRVKAFHSLSSLFFEDMYRFSEWSGVQEGDFSCLETMFIGSAFELMSLPPVPFVSLRNFTLYNCRNVVTLPASTTLQELLISKCANLSELPALSSLQSLKLLNCPSLATVSQFPSLTVLHVCDPFKEEILQRLVNSHMMLEELHIESDTINSICLDPLKLPSLKNLDVRCPNLKSCNAFAGLTSLKILWIRCSPRLHIPDSLRSQLEELRILDF